MSTSATLRGWRPKAPTAYARPVQDEDATWGPLCGAELPDGTGCLVWANGSNVRYAHTASPATWLVDDSVPSADMGTVVGGLSGIQGTSVFVAQGNLYATASYRSGDNHVIDLYQANNVNLPTSWSYKSTIWNNVSAGAQFGGLTGTGHPIILESGRWVLATKVGWGPPDLSFQVVQMRVFTSDNQGTTWTERYMYEHNYFFGRTEFAGAHIAQDMDGKLWFMSGTSATFVDNQIALHQSSDDGTSWTCAFSGGYPYTNPHPIPFLNNGSVMWAFDETYFTFRSFLTGSDGFPDNTNWPDTGISWVAPGVTFYSSSQQRGIVTRRAAYFFLGDQVMRVLGGGWHTGYTGN